MSASEMVPVLVIAGVSSGVGKTTVTLGLLEALHRRGLTVQAFKVGPDFIDPAFHALATGRPSYNLDGWMCGRDQVMATVGERAAQADLALVEGVMGCFDGTDGLTEDGSTAQIAKWLGAPVVLVLVLAGVIFNRVGGKVHRQWLAQAVTSACTARPLGALTSDPGVALPERHLGLVTAVEGGYSPEVRQRLAGLIEAHVDVDTLVGLARSGVRRRAPSARSASVSATIAVARDRAFQFYYPDNLQALERAGARLVFWSPMADQALPAADGLYIGGGYPELYGRELAANAPMLAAVRTFARSGRPVYAECGGLMSDGRRPPGAGCHGAQSARDRLSRSDAHFGRAAGAGRHEGARSRVSLLQARGHPGGGRPPVRHHRWRWRRPQVRGIRDRWGPTVLRPSSFRVQSSPGRELRRRVSTMSTMPP